MGGVEGICDRSGNVLIVIISAKVYIKVKILKYQLLFQCPVMQKNLYLGVWMVSWGVWMVPEVIRGCVTTKSVGTNL